MFKKIFIVMLFSALLFGMAACNIPTSSNALGTAAIQTSIANSVAQTLAAGGIVPGVDVSTSPGAPLSTPYPTLTSTPEIPMLTVSQNTNCRTGPGTEYPKITTVDVGETAEVIAKDPYGTSWYIRNPDNLTGFCWLWGQYATISGNVAMLPIFTPPATPMPTFTSTPAVDFTAAFKSLEYCNPQYAPTFNINNNGSLTWQSVQIIVTDTVTADVKTHTSDIFEEYDGCNLLLVQQDLTPGEPGSVTTTIAPFNYNPAGHAMQATIKVCSLNGLGGTCMTKTITFTP